MSASARGRDGRPYEFVGRFKSKRERDVAVAKRRAELQAGELAGARQQPGEAITCGEYADSVLERMSAGRLLTKSRRRFKASSVDTARQALRTLKREFGDRPLASITRREAILWTEGEDVSAGTVANVVTLFNRAVDEELIAGPNPFRGLGQKRASRAETPPPTEDEMVLLVEACSALGEYAPAMQALLTFAAYSGMRPSELFALEWSDIDLDANRVHVRRRAYKGTTDLPKSNKERTIALTPPARDALLKLGVLDGGLVFRSKWGRQLSGPTLSSYCGKVTARAGLDFDFYLATKHYAVHDLYVRRGLSDRAIAAQMGWSVAATQKLLAVYGHGDVGALEEIDAAFSDAVPMQEEAADRSSERS